MEADALSGRGRRITSMPFSRVYDDGAPGTAEGEGWAVGACVAGAWAKSRFGPIGIMIRTMEMKKARGSRKYRDGWVFFK
jgi:hypothetical protein